jgi:hypothetical protein
MAKAAKKAPGVEVERRTVTIDSKYLGSEPVWDTAKSAEMSDFDFDHLLRQSFNYYNYYYTPKDCKKHVVAWMRTVSSYDAAQVRAFERSSERGFPMTACSLVMCARRGMPMKPNHTQYVISAINRVLADAQPEVVVKTPKAVAYQPTIQDRLNEKTLLTIGELEGHYDAVLRGNPAVKVYDFLTEQAVPQSQLSKFENIYAERRAELESAQSGTDEQLTEAYGHYKAVDYRRMFAFIDAILADIAQYRGVKQATKKLKVKRAPNKEKLVAKLKYAKNHAELKLISINPADIIGTQSLWVYNTKTRKLGTYYATDESGLSIRGTSIVGFSETLSVSKTLRKPAEQIAEFQKSSKPQLRKFLSNIRATETVLNGRINDDIVLLKVV